MKRLMLILLCCMYVSVCTTSCKDDYEGCGGVYAVKISSIDNLLVRVDEWSRNYKHLESDTVTFNQFGIMLRTVTDYVSIPSNKPVFRWFPAAMACTPAISSTIEKITDIRITSNIAYDSAHPVGKNLADIFTISVTKHYDGSSFSELRTPLADYVSGQPTTFKSAIISPRKPPNSSDYQIFTITYLQKGVDVDSVQLTTSSISLTNP